MPKKDHMIKAIFAVAAAAALGGCSTQGMVAVEREHAQQVAASDELVGKAFAKVQKNPLISRADTFWVSRTPLPTTIDPSSQLPPVFSRKIKFNQQATKPLSEVFVNLSNLPEFAGMRFTVAQDVYESDSTKLGMNVNPAPAPKARSNADSASSPLPIAGGGGAGASAASKRGRLAIWRNARMQRQRLRILPKTWASFSGQGILALSWLSWPRAALKSFATIGGWVWIGLGAARQSSSFAPVNMKPCVFLASLSLILHRIRKRRR